MGGRATVLTSVSGGVLSVAARRALSDEGVSLCAWSSASKRVAPGDTRAALMIIGADASHFAEHLADLSEFRSTRWDIPAIALVEESSERTLLAALRTGVTDYLAVPYQIADLLARVAQIIHHDSQPLREQTDVSLRGGEAMVGESAALGAVRRYIAQVAETNSNVLITGETGTGKELAAQLIHANSPRRDRPLVCINCAAVPESLMESELFGYEKGAFTGAYAASAGKLASAHRGTVFFDEIGDMSPVSQAKILRAIESKQVTPLGSVSSSTADFRVIAATNRNLQDMVEKGDFRRDLFFRLNVARVHLPALRERKEDILALLAQAVAEFNRSNSAAVEGFTREALETLLRHDWPGNVRELRNLVEAIFVTCRKGHIAPADLPPHFWKQLAAPEGASSEDARMLAALSEAHWNVSRAAEKLHWSRMTMYRKMEKYSISRCHKA